MEDHIKAKGQSCSMETPRPNVRDDSADTADIRCSICGNDHSSKEFMDGFICENCIEFIVNNL